MKNNRRVLSLVVFGTLVVGLFPLQNAFSAPWNATKTKQIITPIKTNATQLLKSAVPPVGSPNPLSNWQPVICHGTLFNTAEFVNSPVSNGKSLLIQFNQPLGQGSCGASINLPAGIPATTFSYVVEAGSLISQVSFGISGRDSSGNVFYAQPIPSQAPNRPYTLTFDLQNLVALGGQNAKPGTTITELYIRLLSPVGAPARIYLTQPKVNGALVGNMNTRLLFCPPDFDF